MGDLADTVPEKCNMKCDNVAIDDGDDDDSAGGGSTSYETASSSVASQSEKPFPFKGTLAPDNNGMRYESSSTSNFSYNSACRGRKRINLRPRISSSSSSSLDSDDDSKSSPNNSSPSVTLKEWRKKSLLNSSENKNQVIKIASTEDMEKGKQKDRKQNCEEG